MAQIPEDPLIGSYYEWLWKLHSENGDLRSLPKVVEEMRTFYPQRLKREGLTKAELESCERYLVYSGFKKGYASFALGQFEEAIKAFEASVNHIDGIEAQNLKNNLGLPPEFGIYRNRCKDNLNVLRGKIGKRVNADLQNLIWAGERRLALDGRALALVFRNYGEDRSAEFLVEMDRHAKEKKGAFELASISYLKGPANPQGQAIEAFQEAQTLGVECPVGLDPDAAKKSLFDAFDATVGSATFVVIDRAGNYVWFQQDPWKINGGFSSAIVDRIVAGN
jgi:tetratricopeptide (TPR) repeat protein